MGVDAAVRADIATTHKERGGAPERKSLPCPSPAGAASGSCVEPVMSPDSVPLLSGSCSTG
ncbi:hypothetical protein ACIOHC_29550 [Streptomyces sp. NPDC088252]|uniref:hypothetical protein n=1 Tax=Streptomyces sp. NPDC088252 TaxID=3365845 RepID=UPI00381B5E14